LHRCWHRLDSCLSTHRVSLECCQDAQVAFRFSQRCERANAAQLSFAYGFLPSFCPIRLHTRTVGFLLRWSHAPSFSSRVKSVVTRQRSVRDRHRSVFWRPSPALRCGIQSLKSAIDSVALGNQKRHDLLY